jgi:hypothetical protein
LRDSLLVRADIWLIELHADFTEIFFWRGEVEGGD